MKTGELIPKDEVVRPPIQAVFMGVYAKKPECPRAVHGDEWPI
jgi:hypothetical protein